MSKSSYTSACSTILPGRHGFLFHFGGKISALGFRLFLFLVLFDFKLKLFTAVRAVQLACFQNGLVNNDLLTAGWALNAYHVVVVIAAAVALVIVVIIVVIIIVLIVNDFFYVSKVVRDSVQLVADSQFVFLDLLDSFADLA